MSQQGSDRPDRASFLAGPRAAGACARELAQIADTLTQGAADLHASGGMDKPVVRRSPGRCIVQLGPVAITATWLRPSFGIVEGGELLMIVWRGAVAPRNDLHPERASQPAASTATALWEQTLRPVAGSEADWIWESVDGRAPLTYSSTALAERCLERLRSACEEQVPTLGAAVLGTAAPTDTPAPQRRRARIA